MIIINVFKKSLIPTPTSCAGRYSWSWAPGTVAWQRRAWWLAILCLYPRTIGRSTILYPNSRRRTSRSCRRRAPWRRRTRRTIAPSRILLHRAKSCNLVPSLRIANRLPSRAPPVAACTKPCTAPSPANESCPRPYAWVVGSTPARWRLAHPAFGPCGPGTTLHSRIAGIPCRVAVARRLARSRS